jgi:predicted glutamine amidotransferase
MCLAIYKPKGKQIKKEYLLNGYNGNNDGNGFCYAFNGGLHVQRGFKTFEAFWSAFNQIQRKHACLVHFRFATHGHKGESNMHPFVISGGQFAVVHNGVLNIKTTGNESDTGAFSNNVLEPLFARFTFNESLVVYLVETSIGSGNKIAVMRYDGKVVIYNESAGTWHKGVWYSNKGYEEQTKRWEGCSTLSSLYYPKAYWPKNEVVFDETEIENEAISQLTELGVADAESSNAIKVPSHEQSEQSKAYAEYWSRLRN